MIGGVAIVSLVILPFVLGYLFIQQLAQNASTTAHGFVAPTSTLPGLGQKGYHCGGKARLPCGAGLVCSTDSSPLPTEGVCVSATPAVATSTISSITLQQSGACQMTFPACDRGYACIPSVTGASCAAIGSNTILPRILTAKLDGASYADGVYRAPPGTNISITVQASNATAMTYRFGSGETGSFKKSKGGTFTGSFVMGSRVSDDLVVIAASATGASPLWFRVASIQ